MKKTPISLKVLQKLMSDNALLTEAELAKRSGIPQPTIHRILSGKTEFPQKAALEALSALFSVSINQLLGREPLLDKKHLANVSKLGEISKVPLISWEELLNWPAMLASHSSVLGTKWIPTYVNVSKNAFALEVIDSSMEPKFPEGTVLIIDPLRPAKDRDFVIVCLSGKQPVFKQVIIDGTNKYIKSLNPDLSHTVHRLDKNDKIIGALSQALINYME